MNLPNVSTFTNSHPKFPGKKTQIIVPGPGVKGTELQGMEPTSKKGDMKWKKNTPADNLPKHLFKDAGPINTGNLTCDNISRGFKYLLISKVSQVCKRPASRWEDRFWKGHYQPQTFLLEWKDSFCHKKQINKPTNEKQPGTFFFSRLSRERGISSLYTVSMDLVPV